MAKFILSAFSDEAAAPLAEQIEALKESGISCMEPRFINGKGILDLTDEELDGLKAALDEAGIGLSSIGSPIGKYSITDPFEPHFESFKHACAVAKKLGTPRIRLFSFFIPEGEAPAAYRDEVIARMTAMQEYAAAEGLILCHENEARIYGEKAAEVKDLLEAVPGLRAIWDSANYILCDTDPIKGYEACADRLEYCHIKDAIIYDKGIIVPAGEGEGCIKEMLLRISDATDATVYLTLEPHLNAFVGYGAIDDRALAGKGHGHSFKDNRDSFRYGAAALKKVLLEAGFEESETGVFTPRKLEKKRFGILGVGNQGTHYTKLFHEGKIRNAELVAVADTSPSAIAAWSEKYGEVCPAYASLEEMLEKASLDCVMIEVPHYQHPDCAMTAMRAGVAVLVDKPAGVYTSQVEEMYAVQKETGVPLGMMFNQRTNPCFIKMKKIIEAGVIGEIKRVSWIITTWYRNQCYYDSGAWRGTWDGEGGGVLYNQAPHQLDLYQWIVGMQPTKVHAFCHFGKWHNIDVEDDVTAYVEFPNGATGTFITTTADWPGTNRLEITGSRGTLIFDTTKLTLSMLGEDEREFCFACKEKWGHNKVTTTKVPAYGENTQHAGIINNFADALQGLCPIYAPGTDGIHGVALANAMLLSGFEGKTVTMPVDGKKFKKQLDKRVKAALAKKG